MKINVFCFKNDKELRALVKNNGLVSVKDIRLIQNFEFNEYSVILLSRHWTNQKIIDYVRRFDVLTPIYIISTKRVSYKKVNGVICPSRLNYKTIIQHLNIYPQQYIWDFVFFKDESKRQGAKLLFNGSI